MPRSLTPEQRRISEEAHDWLARLEEPPVSERHRAQFNAWLERDPRHKQAFAKAQTLARMAQTLERHDVPDYQRPPRYRYALSYFLDGAAFIAERKALSLGFASAIAACLIVAVFISGRSASLPGDEPSLTLALYESEIGEAKTIALPDGTTVTLGPRSSIEMAFHTDKRLIQLREGTAFFAVAPDPARAFTVSTADLAVTAIGTAFDVRNNGDIFRVGVAEGTVQVSYPLTIDGQNMGMLSSKDLSAGQQIAATTMSGLQDVSQTEMAYIAAWRSDRLVYQDVSIAELVVDLNRYSAIPIALEMPATDAAEMLFSGVFPSTDTDAVLTTLSNIYPIVVDKSSLKETVLRIAKTP